MEIDNQVMMQQISAGIDEIPPMPQVVMMSVISPLNSCSRDLCRRDPRGFASQACYAAGPKDRSKRSWIARVPSASRLRVPVQAKVVSVMTGVSATQLLFCQVNHSFLS